MLSRTKLYIIRYDDFWYIFKFTSVIEYIFSIANLDCLNSNYVVCPKLTWGHYYLNVIF